MGESGDMDAQIVLYNIYLAGKDGIPKNDKKNFYWCYKLAESGYEEAYVNLGISYLDGNGTAKDSRKGFYWVKKAAEIGDSKGMEILSGLYRDGEGTDVDMSQYRYWQKMWKQNQQ